mmetsp:Transcript_74812/g.200562  ORF Transcript_74812/g.200562 Transcript_74812/m.200562 type:complete len:395 (-) Transcript_74812:231-1415(-)
MARHCVQDLLVALGLLPDVEPAEAQPKAVHPPQHVPQPPLGQDAIPALMQRLVHERQVFCQLLRSRVRLLSVCRHPAPFREGCGVADCGLQPVAHVLQEPTVVLLLFVLGRVAPRILPQSPGGADALSLAQEVLHGVRAGPRHRQLPAQIVHLAEVQLSGAHASEVYDAFGEGSRDERVAVPVAAHPGAQGEEGAVDGQRRLADDVERVVHLVVVRRQRFPEALLDHGEPVPSLVLGVGLVAPHRVGAPDAQQTRLHLRHHLAPLRGHELQPPVVLLQQTRQLRVLSQHAAARRLRRVGRQDELRVLRHQRPVDLLRCEALGHEVTEAVLERLGGGAGRRRRLLLPAALVLAPPAHAVVALGQVGVIQELQVHPRRRLDVLSAHALHHIIQLLE